MAETKPNITVNVDVTNPGQFFACCGLLELADRLWPGAEGWFDVANRCFCVDGRDIPKHVGPCKLLEALMKSELKNTMTAAQVERRKELASMPKKERTARDLEGEKKMLDKLWRESPLLIHDPFSIRIDWFLDDNSGGHAFKTWAGQQSVIDIATAMKVSIESEGFTKASSEQWFSKFSNAAGVPFNLDAMLGDQGSDRDVGFSRDPLQISTSTRPLIEFLAFVGLQRCRPSVCRQRNRYRYSIWSQALCPKLAAVAASGCIATAESHHFEFGLLYRTKYLKSFLPATPIGDSA